MSRNGIGFTIMCKSCSNKIELNTEEDLTKIFGDDTEIDIHNESKQIFCNKCYSFIQKNKEEVN